MSGSGGDEFEDDVSTEVAMRDEVLMKLKRQGYQYDSSEC